MMIQRCRISALFLALAVAMAVGIAYAHGGGVLTVTASPAQAPAVNAMPSAAGEPIARPARLWFWEA